MNAFSFKLNLKSFYFGVSNDNEKGHTPTVNTPLKQGSVTKPELSMFQDCDSNINIDSQDDLLEVLGKNSKASCVVTNVLLFDEIFINGTRLDNKSSFCLFLKMENDMDKVQYGRIKLHYPMTLSYSDQYITINHKEIVGLMREYFDGFAFLIHQIDILGYRKINFRASILGNDGIAYSRVFMNYKGDISNKYAEIYDVDYESYDIESIFFKNNTIEEIGEPIGPYSYLDYVRYFSILSKRIAGEYISEHYGDNQVVRNQYSCAAYDFEVWHGIEPRYFIVKHSCTKNAVFTLSRAQAKLINTFSNLTYIILISNITSPSRDIRIIGFDELKSFHKSFDVIRYIEK